MSTNAKIQSYLGELLSVFWLRPETALWRVFDCLLMDNVTLTGTSADLGCGDGILSYIMAGGKVRNYDVFLDMGRVESYHLGTDVFDVPLNVQALSLDSSTLRHRYSWGIDHKASLVNKTKRFGDFYQNTQVLDLNNKLTFDDGFFDSIFSNILYWLDDIHSVLAEWNRILSTSGQIFLFVPDEQFRHKAWLYHDAPHHGYRSYFNCLDRGYKQDERHMYNVGTWQSIFERQGFRIKKHVPYLTDSVMEVYNIGTRPIFPLLMHMTNSLTPEDREKARQEWIDFFFEFFRPIVEGEFPRTPKEGEYAFHLFVLGKNGG